MVEGGAEEGPRSFGPCALALTSHGVLTCPLCTAQSRRGLEKCGDLCNVGSVGSDPRGGEVTEEQLPGQSELRICDALRSRSSSLGTP